MLNSHMCSMRYGGEMPETGELDVEKLRSLPHLRASWRMWNAFRWPTRGMCVIQLLNLQCKTERYECMCIYAVRLLSGPSLGVFGSYYLVQVGFLEVIIWSKFVFLAYKNSGFKRLVLHTQLSFCLFFLSPIFWQFSKNSLFQKKGAKFGFFNFQCFKFKLWKFSFFRFAKTL